MTPGKYNITLYRGAGMRQPFVRRVSRTGPAFNLTGYSAYADIRPHRVAGVVPPTTQLTIPNGGIVFDGVGGRVEMYMTHLQVSSLLVANRYWYDLFLIDPSGEPLPYMTGEITFL